MKMFEYFHDCPNVWLLVYHHLYPSDIRRLVYLLSKECHECFNSWMFDNHHEPLVFSIDVGEDNLGLAMVEATRGGTQYDIVWGRVVSISNNNNDKNTKQLSKLSSKRMILIADQICKVLDNICPWWSVSSRIVIEHQPRELMFAIMSMLVQYFVSRGYPADQIESISGSQKMTFYRRNAYEKLKFILLEFNPDGDVKHEHFELFDNLLRWFHEANDRYGQNKRLAVLLSIIVVMTFSRQPKKWMKIMNSCPYCTTTTTDDNDDEECLLNIGKSDDLCDAFLQGCYFIQKNWFHGGGGVEIVMEEDLNKNEKSFTFKAKATKRKRKAQPSSRFMLKMPSKKQQRKK